MTASQDDVRLAALAGLLHDVGKFAQRAGWGHGAHPEVGAEVVSRIVPAPWRAFMYPVMGHHAHPLTGYATKVVALADRLSAMERTDEAAAQPKQLLSIFCRVAHGDAAAPAGRYWPLKPLALHEDVLFPGDALPEARVEADYAALWDSFLAEAEALAAAHAVGGGDLPSYTESLLMLMQRYTWCVPSAYYRSVPDVSLYDHSRVTAALTACLWGRDEAEIDALLDALHGDEARLVRETEVALLVGGDVSGVQDFIYTITSRGAASALRGRSFYLQLLTEAVARYLLRALDLPATNLLYQGGGHVLLLAPPESEARLRAAQAEISRVLLDHHRGDLYVALGWEPLPVADLRGQALGRHWDALALRQQRAKQRRFHALDRAGWDELFAPQGHGGNLETQCSVCGREHVDVAVDPDRADLPSREQVRKCAPCRAYEDLGRDLRTAHFMVAETLDPALDAVEAGRGDWQAALARLGLRVTVSEGLPHPQVRGARRVVYALDDGALAALHPSARTAVGRRLLVNVTPTLTEDEVEVFEDKIEDDLEAGNVKPFSVLEAQAQGIARLGVLRMDVDDLGDLFSDGLGKHATLSRMAGLSFAVSLYFEGWVGAAAEAVNDAFGSKRLYAIYAGGDDLFFVGAWDAVVALARRVRADLTRFAAGHPGIHASAGIALVGGKYPLYQAAQAAGGAELAAKAHPGKDAVTFLGATLPWATFGPDGETDLKTVSGMQAHLRVLLEQGEAPASALSTLLQLYADYVEVAESRRREACDRTRTGEEQVLWGPWMWRGYYRLKRQGKRHPKVDHLADMLHKDDFRAIAWLGVAARWTELLRR